MEPPTAGVRLPDRRRAADRPAESPWHSVAPASRSTSPESTMSPDELAELEIISSRIGQAAVRLQEHVVRMHNDLTSKLGIPSYLDSFRKIEVDKSQAERHHWPYTQNHGGENTSKAIVQQASGAVNVAAEKSELTTYDPCENLRLRLNLQPIDPDFQSFARDKALGNLFKTNLRNYIHQILPQYEGQLPLEELKEIGVLHARRCIKKVATSHPSQRRRLLQFGAAQDQWSENGFIGDLPRIMRSRVLLKMGKEQYNAKDTARCASFSQAHSGDRNIAVSGSASPVHPDHSFTWTSESRSELSFEASNALSAHSSSHSLRHSPSTAPQERREAIRAEFRHSVDDSGFASPQTKSQANLKDEEEYSSLSRPNIRGQHYQTSHLLRWRELGGGTFGTRYLDESCIAHRLHSILLEDLYPWKRWGYASKDILNIAWSPSGRNFAIGASADLDDRSLQYNKNNNLLFGDIETNKLFELEDHRLNRPRPEEIRSGDNSREEMYNAVDPYIYTTVTAISFDRSGNHMYTTSYDKTAKIWDLTSEKPVCSQTLQHSDVVILLDTSLDSRLLVTAQDSHLNSIRLHQLENGAAHFLHNIESERARARGFRPTSLKFGSSPSTSHLLLAGFSENRIEHGQHDCAGDLSLWDIRTGIPSLMKLNPKAPAVFDIAWHPHNPYFAAAMPTQPGDVQAHRSGIKSYVRTWDPLRSPNRVFEFDCPAFDVNEVRFHPNRDHYISASCTDGATYIWDARKTQEQVLCLQHGKPIDPIDEEEIERLGYRQAREEHDTGVRFIEWDGGGKYLYTGASDGVIKQWNPWVSKEEAFVRNVTSYDSHVMSGSFSPDYSHLLVGTAKGSAHILSSAPLTTVVDKDDGKADVPGETELFDFIPAQQPVANDEDEGRCAAQEMLASGEIAIHPFCGAGKGPMYKGPYASWARKNIPLSDLASSELDADVLADQLHPSQWQKGLSRGGKPKISAEERQAWLSEQIGARTLSQRELVKRPRGLTISPASVAGTPEVKRARPITDMLPENSATPPTQSSRAHQTDGVLPPANIGGPSQDQEIIGSPSPPTLPQAESLETERGPYHTASAPTCNAHSITGTESKFALHTPSPTSVRFKKSPQSSSPSRSIFGPSPKGPARFRMPREFVPKYPTPWQDKESRRAQALQAVASAREKGEVISLEEE